MKLTHDDIKRIIQEVKDDEFRRLNDKYEGWYQECLHEDAGDRI